MRRDAFDRYASAVLIVGGALLVKLIVAPLLDEPAPFLLFLGAVAASAWRSGLGPGLLAAGLAAVASQVFFRASGAAVTDVPARLAVFAVESAAVAVFVALGHRSRSRPEPVHGENGEAEAILRSVATELQAVLDSALDGVVGMSAGGVITFWNPPAETIFGWSAAEALGRDLAELILPPTDRETFRAGLRRFLQTGHSDVLGRRLEGRGLRRDRSHFPLEVSITARRERKSWAFTAFMADITERKQAEERRRHEQAYTSQQVLAREQGAREEAETANRMKDEFLAMLSHELRTPLSAIAGWAHILRQGGLDAADTARAIEVIDRNAKVQGQLICDILDVSRIITGKLRLEMKAVPARTVVEAALDTVRPAAEAKRVRIETAVDPGAGMVWGDPDRLQQVVWNLLSNAIKFSPDGGAVHLRLARVGSQVEIGVRDSGEGISPEFLPHVFERFRQADSSASRPHGGLGLGLAIVRHLVEAHGGTVAAESAGRGRGATFTVRLPLHAANVEAAPPPESAPSDEVPFLDQLRVLVVDDDADTRGMMETVLTQRGARVVAAASAAEALACVEREPPDVLLSDIGMPGMDGYALIRELRGRPGARAIPAAALTAYAHADDRGQAIAAGYQVHLAKPVEPDALVAVVASLAGRR